MFLDGSSIFFLPIMMMFDVSDDATMVQMKTGKWALSWLGSTVPLRWDENLRDPSEMTGATCGFKERLKVDLSQLWIC